MEAKSNLASCSASTLSPGAHNLSHQAFSHAYKHHATGPLLVLFPPPRMSLLPLILPPNSLSIQETPTHLRWSSSSLKLAPSWPPSLVAIYKTNHFPLSLSALHTYMYYGTYLYHSCVFVSSSPLDVGLYSQCLIHLCTPRPRTMPAIQSTRI